MLNLRPIRSYVRRQGRMTPTQNRALQALWETYVSNLDGLDWHTLFARKAPIELEIGFGMGDNLAQMAQARPEHNFIGVEVHQPGVGALMIKCQQLGLTNVKIFCVDTNEVLACMPDPFLHRAYILFPDPWPKKRHNKRRLIQADFVQTISQKLTQGGQLHMATDWQDYAEQMLETTNQNPSLRNMFVEQNFAPLQYCRFPTKFEARGERLGHSIFDLAYTRC